MTKESIRSFLDQHMKAKSPFNDEQKGAIALATKDEIVTELSSLLQHEPTQEMWRIICVWFDCGYHYAKYEAQQEDS